jgi:hypothetical protein
MIAALGVFLLPIVIIDDLGPKIAYNKNLVTEVT